MKNQFELRNLSPNTDEGGVGGDHETKDKKGKEILKELENQLISLSSEKDLEEIVGINIRNHNKYFYLGCLSVVVKTCIDELTNKLNLESEYSSTSLGYNKNHEMESSYRAKLKNGIEYSIANAETYGSYHFKIPKSWEKPIEEAKEKIQKIDRIHRV